MNMNAPSTQITSSTNAQFKIWKSLTTSKGIKENNLFFLMGEKLVQEFLESPIEGFKAEYIIHDAEIPHRTSAKKTFLSKDLFKELDVLGTKTPMLILSFQDFPLKDFKSHPKGLELISPLGDPRNLGALTRTALGFGVTEMILTKESTNPFLPHAIKASAGAALKMKFTKSALAVNEIPLCSADYALALHGESLIKTEWPKNLRLWVGEEGPGLALEHSQKKFMKFVNIPTTDVESLNAMVSTSLAIWEWKKQRTSLS
ncbi:MAG: TrmH family RNA methyltransferase [Pseudobdellovibrio sp.]